MITYGRFKKELAQEVEKAIHKKHPSYLKPETGIKIAIDTVIEKHHLTNMIQNYHFRIMGKDDLEIEICYIYLIYNTDKRSNNGCGNKILDFKIIDRHDYITEAQNMQQVIKSIYRNNCRNQIEILKNSVTHYESEVKKMKAEIKSLQNRMKIK